MLLAPTTSPLKSLHKGSGRRDLSHEQFTRSIFLCKDLQVFKLVNVVVRVKHTALYIIKRTLRFFRTRYKLFL